MATWYDRRLDAGNLLFDYYMRVSEDGGATWTASERVSDVSSAVVLDPNLATSYHGDYDQQTQYAGLAYTQWSDDRPQFGHNDPNVYFDQNAVAPDFTIGVSPLSLAICTPADAVYTVEVGQIMDFSDPVTLSASGNPGGTTASFRVNPVTPPGNTTLTIGNTGAAAAGSYTIAIDGNASGNQHSTSVGYRRNTSSTGTTRTASGHSPSFMAPIRLSSSSSACGFSAS